MSCHFRDALGISKTISKEVIWEPIGGKWDWMLSIVSVSQHSLPGFGELGAPKVKPKWPRKGEKRLSYFVVVTSICFQEEYPRRQTSLCGRQRTTVLSEQWRLRRQLPMKHWWFREMKKHCPLSWAGGGRGCSDSRQVFHQLWSVIGKWWKHRDLGCPTTPGTKGVVTIVSTGNISLTFAQENCWISSMQQKELSVF